MYNGCEDILDEQTDWMARVIKSIWKYSTSMWKARCDDVHGVVDAKSGSKRRKELMQLIKMELDRTKYFGEYEIRQLR